MTDFPATDQILPPTISSNSMYSLGGVAMATSLGSSNSSWPANNNAYFIPFSLPAPFVVRAGFWHNGATTSGNVDFGVYDLGRSLIVSSGSTAQGTVSVPQIVTLTETILAPGAYYFALSCDNTTSVFARNTYTDEQLFGILKVASLHPLTTLPTLIGANNDYQPFVGIASITTF